MFLSDFSTCFRDDRLCPFPSSFLHSGMSQLMLSRGRGTSLGTRDIGRTGGHNRRHHLAVIFICHLPTPSLRMGHGAACARHACFPAFLGFSNHLQVGGMSRAPSYPFSYAITNSSHGSWLLQDDKTKVIVAPLILISSSDGAWNSATGSSDDISESGTRGHSFHSRWTQNWGLSTCSYDSSCEFFTVLSGEFFTTSLVFPNA